MRGWVLRAEVDIEIPNALLAGFGRRRIKRRGIGFTTDTYVVDDQLIWGATARILGELFARLEAAGLS